MRSPGQTAARHGGMKSFVQVVGGFVLGRGPASAVGLDPSVLFALFTVGLGLALLRIGLFMTEDPTAGRPNSLHDRTLPPDG